MIKGKNTINGDLMQQYNICIVDIYKQVNMQVWDRVWRQIENQVEVHIVRLVNRQVRDKVKKQVYLQSKNQICRQLEDETLEI